VGKAYLNIGTFYPDHQSSDIGIVLQQFIYILCIVLGYGLDDQRVWVPAGAGNFSLHYRVQTGSGMHSASYPVGTRGFSLGVKQLGHEADHSPPFSAKVNNAWSYTSTPICLHGMVLLKHRDTKTCVNKRLALYCKGIPNTRGDWNEKSCFTVTCFQTTTCLCVVHIIVVVKNAEPLKIETQPTSNGELDEQTLQQNRLRLAQRMAVGGKSPKSRTEK